MGLLAFWVYVILIIVSMIKKNNKKAKKCAVGAVIGIGMMGLGMFGSFVSAVKQYEFNFDNLDTFKVESDSLERGIWKNEISNQADGRNLNPELHWDSVKGAERYYVIMIDESADNWMHWYAENVTDNSIEEGLFTDEFSEVSSKDGITTKGQYVGPYPPSGTHTYTVYVFALKLETYSVSDINFDGAGNDIEEIAKQLNILITIILSATVSCRESILRKRETVPMATVPVVTDLWETPGKQTAVMGIRQIMMGLIQVSILHLRGEIIRIP